MKSTLISRITAFGLLALSTELLLAQNVNLNQLPAAVQREAQTELKNGPINLKKASNCSVGAQDRPENQGFWTLLLHCTKANPGVALVQDAKRHA